MIENITAAFQRYCETGVVDGLKAEDLGYLEHALAKAKRNATGREPTIRDHQLFLLMSLQGDSDKVVPFLEEVAKKYYRKPN